jgi:CDP-diacylglycerol--serine O-phosphatidyltransferase
MGKRRRLDLRKTLFLLPNMITLSSIFCGFDSIRVASSATSEDDYLRAALLIVFAMFLDMLDGRVARATKTQSAFGLQIDSLADVVSFGCAPAILVYQWTLHRLGLTGLIASFVFLACGAVRLARFNVLSMGEEGKPTKPSKYIVGLPIPGAAGILVSIIVTNHAVAGALGKEEYAWPIFAVTLLLSFFMVSTIRFRSFKDVKLNVRTVLLVGFAVGSSVIISTQLKPAFVLVWLLGFYILLGIFESLWQLPARLRERAALAREAASTSTPPPPNPSNPPPP